MKTTRRALFAALLAVVAGTGHVPAAPAPPRPDATLLYTVTDTDGIAWVSKIEVWGGEVRPPALVWKGEETLSLRYGGLSLVARHNLVARCGSVIDLTDGQVINPEKNGRLHGVVGNRVIYHVDADGREGGIFAFDLPAKKLERIADLGEGRYGLPGCVSPDGTKSVANRVHVNEETRRGPHRIVLAEDELSLHRLAQGPLSLGKGFEAYINCFGRSLSPPPVLWIDDRHILTQVNNGELVSVSLDGKRKPFAKIPLPAGSIEGSGHLYRDGGGRIIYCDFGAPPVVVDAATGTWKACDWEQIRHGFERDFTTEEHDTTFRYQGKDIAKVRISQAFTTAGYLAVNAPGTNGMGDEIRIWSVAAGKWATIQVQVDYLVGWMK